MGHLIYVKIRLNSMEVPHLTHSIFSLTILFSVSYTIHLIHRSCTDTVIDCFIFIFFFNDFFPIIIGSDSVFIQKLCRHKKHIVYDVPVGDNGLGPVFEEIIVRPKWVYYDERLHNERNSWS